MTDPIKQLYNDLRSKGYSDSEDNLREALRDKKSASDYYRSNESNLGLDKDYFMSHVYEKSNIDIEISNKQIDIDNAKIEYKKIQDALYDNAKNNKQSPDELFQKVEELEGYISTENTNINSLKKQRSSTSKVYQNLLYPDSKLQSVIKKSGIDKQLQETDLSTQEYIRKKQEDLVQYLGEEDRNLYSVEYQINKELDNNAHIKSVIDNLSKKNKTSENDIQYLAANDALSKSDQILKDLYSFKERKEYEANIGIENAIQSEKKKRSEITESLLPSGYRDNDLVNKMINSDPKIKSDINSIDNNIRFLENKKAAILVDEKGIVSSYKPKIDAVDQLLPGISASPIVKLTAYAVAKQELLSEYKKRYDELSDSTVPDVRSSGQTENREQMDDLNAKINSITKELKELSPVVLLNRGKNASEVNKYSQSILKYYGNIAASGVYRLSQNILDTDLGYMDEKMRAEILVNSLDDAGVKGYMSEGARSDIYGDQDKISKLEAENSELIKSKVEKDTKDGRVEYWTDKTARDRYYNNLKDISNITGSLNKNEGVWIDLLGTTLRFGAETYISSLLMETGIGAMSSMAKLSKYSDRIKQAYDYLSKNKKTKAILDNISNPVKFEEAIKAGKVSRGDRYIAEATKDAINFEITGRLFSEKDISASEGFLGSIGSSAVEDITKYVGGGVTGLMNTKAKKLLGEFIKRTVGQIPAEFVEEEGEALSTTIKKAGQSDSIVSAVTDIIVNGLKGNDRWETIKEDFSRNMGYDAQKDILVATAYLSTIFGAAGTGLHARKIFFDNGGDAKMLEDMEFYLKNVKSVKYGGTTYQFTGEKWVTNKNEDVDNELASKLSKLSPDAKNGSSATIGSKTAIFANNRWETETGARLTGDDLDTIISAYKSKETAEFGFDKIDSISEGDNIVSGEGKSINGKAGDVIYADRGLTEFSTTAREGFVPVKLKYDERFIATSDGKYYRDQGSPISGSYEVKTGSEFALARAIKKATTRQGRSLRMISRLMPKMREIKKEVNGSMQRLRVILHDADSYLKQTNEASRGYYDPENHVVHINLSAATGVTSTHEVIHPYLNAMFDSDPELKTSFYNSVQDDYVALYGDVDEAIVEYATDRAIYSIVPKLDTDPTFFSKVLNTLQNYLGAKIHPDISLGSLISSISGISTEGKNPLMSMLSDVKKNAKKVDIGSFNTNTDRAVKLLGISTQDEDGMPFAKEDIDRRISESYSEMVASEDYFGDINESVYNNLAEINDERKKWIEFIDESDYPIEFKAAVLAEVLGYNYDNGYKKRGYGLVDSLNKDHVAKVFSSGSNEGILKQLHELRVKDKNKYQKIKQTESDKNLEDVNINTIENTGKLSTYRNDINLIEKLDNNQNESSWKNDNPELVKAVEDLLGKPTESKEEVSDVKGNKGWDRDVESTAKALENIDDNNKKEVYLQYGIEEIPQSTGNRTGRNKSGSLTPLKGSPIVQGATGADQNIVSAAEKYAKQKGITLKRQAEYVEINPEFSKRIADAFEAMPHDPTNPKVKEAYQNLIQQTKDQYDALVADGYEFSFFDNETDPYEGNPYNAIRDLRNNKKMAVYGTYDGYGTEGITAKELENNPMLADTGIRWKDQNGVERVVTANDLFRAVHDAFGHSIEGAGFRARGEENAWQAHSRLYTGSALGAMTTETRGQNSWLNFGKYGELNRNAKVEDTVFAEQKVGLMPEWTWKEYIAPDVKTKDELLSESYHKAKADGSNPELVKAVESLLSKEQTPTALRDVESEKKQIEDFGVAKEDVEATHGLLGRVFDGLKKAGLTAAKNVGEWVGIGKGSEKPYSLKIGDKEVQVKNVQPEVVNGFYSPLEKIITESKFDKLPAKQWAEKYANSEEAKWTGLKDWLAQQQGSVSKADIQQYLKDNRIQVVEVVKGGDVSESEIDTFLNDEMGEGYTREEARDYLSNDENNSQTKFQQYQLEGEKENYKEYYIVLPKEGRMGKVADWRVPPAHLSGDEFVDNRQIVRLRMNTRIDSEGNKVLFIEEHQADKGQEGRNKGFAEPFKESDIDIQTISKDAVILDKKAKNGDFIIGSKDGIFEYRSAKTIEEAEKELKDVNKPYYKLWVGDNLIGEGYDKQHAIKLALKNQDSPSKDPFSTETANWVKLGLKVALKEAVKQGATKIAWTTGEQQNERYDLSKQVDEIGWQKNKNGTYNITPKKDGSVIGTRDMMANLTLKQVEDYVGKDVAQKIENEEGKEWDGGDVKQGKLKGQQLKVGGKGMKGFYGSPTEGSLGIVGNVAKSLFKQEPKTVKIPIEKKSMFLESGEEYELTKEYILFDDNGKEYDRTISKALAEALVKINGGSYKYTESDNLQKSTQHSIDITPEMKASVERGQPLFKTEESKKEFGGFETRDGKPIGFTYDTEKVARERFDISKLKKIGSGSDRDVYDLGNGKVLKVAKTARGLTQNIYEGDYYLTSVVPEVTERGLNYVVAENTPRMKTSDVVEIFDWDGNVTGKTTAGEMLKELQKFSQRDMNNHDSKLQDTLAKYGLQDIMNYEVLWNDFVAQRNWGYKDGKAYHSDGGTFGGVDMIDSYKGKTNLSDPEFKKIYEESRRLKKQFGDTDKATMYSKDKGEIQAQYRIESGKNIIEAIKNFDGSKKAIVALTHEIMHPTVVSIIDGAKEGNEVGKKHTQTIVNEFNKANPNSSVTIEDLIKGNDAFKDGTTSKQYRQVQEFIAKAWEKYHTEGGKGFSEAFQKVLDQITKAFQSVYKSITGKQLTPELKQMFDEILGKEAPTQYTEAVHRDVKEKQGISNPNTYSKIKELEESSLKNYAEQNGLMDDLPKGEVISDGNESDIYHSEDDTKFIKVTTPNNYNSWLEMLDSIAIHNSENPNMKIKILGFTINKDGEFALKTEQNKNESNNQYQKIPTTTQRYYDAGELTKTDIDQFESSVKLMSADTAYETAISIVDTISKGKDALDILDSLIDFDKSEYNMHPIVVESNNKFLSTYVMLSAIAKAKELAEKIEDKYDKEFAKSVISSIQASLGDISRQAALTLAAFNSDIVPGEAFASALLPPNSDINKKDSRNSINENGIQSTDKEELQRVSTEIRDRLKKYIDDPNGSIDDIISKLLVKISSVENNNTNISAEKYARSIGSKKADKTIEKGRDLIASALTRLKNIGFAYDPKNELDALTDLFKGAIYIASGRISKAKDYFINAIENVLGKPVSYSENKWNDIINSEEGKGIIDTARKEWAIDKLKKLKDRQQKQSDTDLYDELFARIRAIKDKEVERVVKTIEETITNLSNDPELTQKQVDVLESAILQMENENSDTDSPAYKETQDKIEELRDMVEILSGKNVISKHSPEVKRRREIRKIINSGIEDRKTTIRRIINNYIEYGSLRYTLSDMLSMILPKSAADDLENSIFEELDNIINEKRKSLNKDEKNRLTKSIKDKSAEIEQLSSKINRLNYLNASLDILADRLSDASGNEAVNLQKQIESIKEEIKSISGQEAVTSRQDILETLKNRIEFLNNIDRTDAEELELAFNIDLMRSIEENKSLRDAHKDIDKIRSKLYSEYKKAYNKSEEKRKTISNLVSQIDSIKDGTYRKKSISEKEDTDSIKKLKEELRQLKGARGVMEGLTDRWTPSKLMKAIQQGATSLTDFYSLLESNTGISPKYRKAIAYVSSMVQNATIYENGNVTNTRIAQKASAIIRNIKGQMQPSLMKKIFYSLVNEWAYNSMLSHPTTTINSILGSVTGWARVSAELVYRTLNSDDRKVTVSILKKMMHNGSLAMAIGQISGRSEYAVNDYEKQIMSIGVIDRIYNDTLSGIAKDKSSTKSKIAAKILVKAFVTPVKVAMNIFAATDVFSRNAFRTWNEQWDSYDKLKEVYTTGSHLGIIDAMHDELGYKEEIIQQANIEADRIFGSNSILNSVRKKEYISKRILELREYHIRDHVLVNHAEHTAKKMLLINNPETYIGSKAYNMLQHINRNEQEVSAMAIVGMFLKNMLIPFGRSLINFSHKHTVNAIIPVSYAMSKLGINLQYGSPQYDNYLSTVKAKKEYEALYEQYISADPKMKNELKKKLDEFIGGGVYMLDHKGKERREPYTKRDLRNDFIESMIGYALAGMIFYTYDDDENDYSDIVKAPSKIRVTGSGNGILFSEQKASNYTPYSIQIKKNGTWLTIAKWPYIAPHPIFFFMGTMTDNYYNRNSNYGSTSNPVYEAMYYLSTAPLAQSSQQGLQTIANIATGISTNDADSEKLENAFATALSNVSRQIIYPGAYGFATDLIRWASNKDIVRHENPYINKLIRLPYFEPFTDLVDYSPLGRTYKTKFPIEYLRGAFEDLTPKTDIEQIEQALSSTNANNVLKYYNVGKNISDDKDGSIIIKGFPIEISEEIRHSVAIEYGTRLVEDLRSRDITSQSKDYISIRKAIYNASEKIFDEVTKEIKHVYVSQYVRSIIEPYINEEISGNYTEEELYRMSRAYRYIKINDQSKSATKVLSELGMVIHDGRILFTRKMTDEEIDNAINSLSL